MLIVLAITLVIMGNNMELTIHICELCKAPLK